MQNHGVGNVSHMKLIKTNELITFGHTTTQFIQWIDRALHQGQFTMYFSHELMEMQASFVFDRHCIEKTIHQKTLATAYTTEHVNASRQFGFLLQKSKWTSNAFLIGRPFMGAAF